MSLHSTHPDIIKRLNRAAGHLRSTIQMLEDEKPCLDIAQQLHAVEKAISNAKRVLIHDHLDHCLEDVLSNEHEPSGNALNEFKEITKYL
ncbi:MULTISPECIES: metal-sensing transcriptional repressor [Enterobacteriaceae]|uniref:metal-sensing transcriptional repressor n=1 Tax=Enterobacteriaceae TaxID=543 RepID=UPI0006A57C3C|nr:MULTISPECIES: metal-sensing transcriptional repressor [Enterobacteriaceae]EKS6729922.1 metal-sensing transcriptional repressor [Enterobacter mori]EES0030184.1 metal-sensing transcriptional repressor [Escherichia coli]MBX8911102.1 metal-sensing transcriptional repressor [Enterobacter ludwigii]MCD9354855.1 metal-sensing transcriptional repressor [Klebsiella pneumoniae]MCD9375877.1 metal-sensing transcriptional repressor [Klebsiella pneumoniae]